MIKAIVFDCFGVLVEQSLQTYYKKYFNNDEEQIKNAEIYLDQANKGMITHDEVMQKYADLAGIPVEETKEVLEYNPVNEELFKFIEHDLKLKYKLGFLSNASDDWLDELFTKTQISLFDATVLSYKVGYAKPEPQIYAIMAERLDVRLDECVFIDDRQDYVDGAIGVGMESFVYTSVDKLKKDLESIL